MRRRPVLVVLTLIVSSACSIAFRVDDITGESPATMDDGGGIAEGGPLDAQSDARWCEREQAAEFCKDFDDGQPLAAGWREDSTPSSGSLSLTSDAVASPPRALLAKVTKTGGCENQHFVREQPFDASRGEVRVEAKLRIGDAAGLGLATGRPLTVSLPECALALYVRPGFAALGEDEWFAGGQSTSRPLTRPVEAGRWTRAEMVLRRTGGATSASVLLDGEVVLADEPVASKCGWGRVDVRAGLICSEPMEARIDDIRIEVR